MGDIPPEDESSSKGSSETTSSRRRKQATEDGSSSSSDIDLPASKIPETSNSAEKSVHIQASLPPGQSVDGSCPFIILSESTHDIQRTEHHLGQLSDLTGRLEEAINTTNERVTSRWATRDHPYSKVSVLLLSWKDDDLGVRSEVNQLRSLFADTFNYDVDEWQLPSGPTCYLALLNKLGEFTSENGGPDTLIIIYYGGHAYQSAKRASYGPIWVSYV